MRVGLDLQLARGTATGIGEYARGLFDALESSAAVPGLSFVALENARLDPWRFDRRVLWDQVMLPFAASRAGVDLVHCTAGTMPLVVTVPCVATVHDVAWFRVQAHARPYARAYFGSFSLARYVHARAVFVDSQFSRDELLALAPSLDPARTIVAYPGVARDVASLARARNDDAPFILAVGTVEPRKNLEVVVRALAAIPQLRLVSVGPSTAYVERVRAIAHECGVADRVEIRGYVSRSELLGLYAQALVAVAPSHYEGFGYAAAQALCAGVPLVAARASSLPEVVDGMAPLVDPADVSGWVDALRAVVEQRDTSEAHAHTVRRAAGERFAWAATARIIAQAYDDALR